MSVINTSNAIPAKARAKYGRRLKQNDYKNLLLCKSVSEVVSYLKSHTHYESSLTKVNEYEVHRGQIEMILRQKLFYDFDSLCRYEMSIDSAFSRFIVRRYEIIQLIRFMTLLNSGRSQDYIFSMPSYFNKHTDIHLNELIRATNYDELLHAVRNSPYEEILKKFKPKNGEIIDIASVEDQLYFFLYDGLFNAINKLRSKSEKDELKKLFDSIIDFTNFSRIYRLKVFYRQTVDKITKRLLPFGTIKPDQTEALCRAESTEEFTKMVFSLPSGRIIKKMHYNYPGEIPTRAKFLISRNNMYFSESPAVVLLSYVFVTEIELSNIINIIEGVRYGLAPEEIDKLLIYNK